MNIYKKYRGKLQRSLNGRGIFNTIVLIFNKSVHRFQFRRYDFWGLIDPSDLDGSEELKKHAVKYEASNQIFFKKLLDSAEWQFKTSTFVDFGCGKGAALIYASEFGFKKIIGVEFSPNLAQLAIDNLEKFSVPKGEKVDFEIVNIDASQYEIPPEADCFYFFNPFDGFIMNKVIQNIVRSLETNPRKILIVYLNAVYKDVIEKYGFKRITYFSKDELDYYFYNGGCVYTNDLMGPGKVAG